MHEQAQRQQERAELLATQQKLQNSLAQTQLEIDAKRSELLIREQSIESTTERLHQLEIQLNNVRHEAQNRATQQWGEQQQSQEEFTAVRAELEASISRLTEQLQQRETELAAFHQRGREAAEILTKTLDGTRQELRELQVQQCHKEEQWTSYRSQVEEQLANLTTQLSERERQLTQRDGELAERQDQSVQLDGANQNVKQLEEHLAQAAAVNQAEAENWLAEKNSYESQLVDLQAWHREEGTCREQLEIKCSSIEAQRSELEAQICRAQETAHGREDLEGQLANLQNKLEQVTARETGPNSRQRRGDSPV